MSVVLPTPGPSLEPQTGASIKERYRYWRIRIFYSIYVGYALFYFTRKSFTFAMPGLISSLGLEKETLGFLTTILSISYALSKLLSGILSDRSNLRYFMSIGLISTGIFTIFFGLSSSFLLFSLFLSANGFFQAWGATSCAKFLTHWYAQEERGRWWGAWNTSHNVGGALIPLVGAFSMQILGWRYAMHIPGALAILGGIFLLNRLRDKPSSLGLPAVEEVYSHGAQKGRATSPAFSIRSVLKNGCMWTLALSFFFVHVIRDSINNWMQIYLIEQKGYTLMVAGSCVSWFEIGGILGSLVAGWMSDTIFRGNRGPVNTLFSIGVIAMLGVLWMLPMGSWVVVSSAMFCMGLLLFGPQMLIGMAAAELVEKRAAGTATGFVGFFAYLGAAMGGWPVARIVQGYAWIGFFAFLAICALFSFLLLFFMRFNRVRAI